MRSKKWKECLFTCLERTLPLLLNDARAYGINNLIMATKKNVFISYDFGLKGDYNGLFAWLDSQGAKECGGNLALIQREFDKNDHNYVFDKLTDEIKLEVKIERNDRIYAIVRARDGVLKGKFLFGGRKLAPWKGFATDHFD